jgi:predicted  nucleic acid-binding Zn-ribbon protein
MATWNETLKHIEGLRQARRQADDNLYAIQLELIKAEESLKRIKKEETLLPGDIRAIETLRQKIASLEEQLREINKQINRIEGLFQKIYSLSEKIQIVEKKIQSLSDEIAALTNEINNSRNDPNKVKQLQAKLEEMRRLLAELKNDLAKSNTELQTLRRQQQETERQRNELERQRQDLQREINALLSEIKNRMSPAVPSRDEAERRIRDLQEEKKRARVALDEATKNLGLAVEAIYVDPHPRSVVSNLDDGIPFLFLPVRIETRFMITQEARELWLRVYPDDLAIHTHEKVLTTQEISEGEKYWRFLFEAEKKDEEEKEALRKDAWSNLVLLFSPQRSAWIARQTKPLNWNEVTEIESADELTFPQQPQSKPFEWSRAPRTNTLPDKFVVLLYQGDTIAKEVAGGIIPDELFMGPDPLEANAAFVEAAEDQTLTFGSDYDWTANFDRAVEKGMGFRIALNVDEAERGFDKILVLGVYASASEGKSKEEVEELIDNHHYSPKGFSLVKQGTSTNNTEGSESGFTTNDAFDKVSYFVETGDALFDDDDDCDGKNLANALGIEYDPLRYVMNSNGKDLREARAMNVALYPSTLGFYFATMMKPVLDEPSQDRLRSFFTEYVSGRGPIPAIRVGNQPYGVLLTSDFSKWQWSRQEPEFGTPFLSMLFNILNHYHNVWKSLANQLMYTGKPGVDPTEVLINILGLQPGSASFFQRNAFSTEQLYNNAQFQYGGKYYNDVASTYTSKALLINFLRSFGYELPVVNGKVSIPQLFHLVYQHFHTRLNPANIIEELPLSESDPLHNYIPDKNYIHWLLEADTIQKLERQDFGTDIKAPTSLLYMQLRRAMLLAIADASVKWFTKNNIPVSHVMEATSFHNIRATRDLTKWEVMKGKVSIALPGHPHSNMAVAEYLLTAGATESDATFLNRMKQSLDLLAGVSTASLERCFTEHIDTCTYRLDAWQTALFDYRLKKQRRQSSTTGELPDRKKGLYLAAYGWVEDIRPGSKRKLVGDEVDAALQPPNGKPVYEYADNGGFVHAPSINQATAAAVLRSGYLSHASSSNPDVMAVNLSSERVRRALFILEGLRNGQRLEVLLGFQFERGLHDRGSANDDLKRLNQYIYDFRDTFTISRNLIQQEGVPDTTTETIETNNVVDGLKLAESTKPYPYDVTMDLSNLSAAQLAGIESAIKAEKDALEDTLDAIKDLLLSESVYQMVQGNFDRTAAITMSLKDANIPQSVEVIETPQSSHLSFTNRVTVQFDSDAVYVGPNPRAKMEAGLNAWLNEVVGDPSTLVCIVSHMVEDIEEDEINISDLGLEPIDLVYMMSKDMETGKNNAEAGDLESRIAFHYRRKYNLGDDVTIKIQFTGGITPGRTFIGNILPLLKTLKSIITDSRPLNAMDFDPPSKKSLADKDNPNGYALPEIHSRIENMREEFEECFDNLADITITKIDGTAGTDMQLGDLFDEMNEASQTFADIEFSFSFNNALTLQNALIAIAGFGLSDTFPQVTDVTDDTKKQVLLEQARAVARRMIDIMNKMNVLFNSLSDPANTETEKKVAILIEAGKTLFGADFNVLPHFTYNNSADIHQSNQHRDQMLLHAKNQLQMKFPSDEWMQKSASVRPRLAKWDYVRTLHELYNDGQLDLAPIQLPYRAADSWLAVEFPETDADGNPFNVTDDTLSIVVHGVSAFTTEKNQCGLLIDDWTENICEKKAITGLTFNYNQPDAQAPQALLLAVTPQETGNWSWDKLVGILNDTLLRAKLRAIEPALLDTQTKPELGVLLPAIMSTYSQQGLDISLDYRNNIHYYAENLSLTALG